ncbi:PH domain-containing protein [Gynurincola endophyticus]|uniref:PH domain-containing protein n=1 Tax=Gynurincola endophyticus TaxID=2479004 RepID=UPI000F8E121E|nr:PH domain-containing protein [Gynurincola endophyticus]
MTNSYNEPQKLPVNGIWYILTVSLTKTLKTLLVPLIVLITSRRTSDFMWQLLVIVYPVITLINALIKMRTFNYYVQEQSLIIEYGLFKKEKINIPFKKITGINIEQRFLHQPFGLALMKIETAGTNKTEGEIPSIEMRKALELKEIILEKASADETIEEKKEPLLRLNSAQLLRFAISDNHIRTFFLVLGISWIYLNRMRELMGDDWVRDITNKYIFHWYELSVYVYVILIVLILAIAYSVIKTFLKFDGFVLQKDHLSYQYQAGLIDKKNTVIPFRKVQFVRMKTNWWRKKWNIYNIILRQSQAGESNKENKKSFTFPVFDKEMYRNILNTYYHDLTEESATNRVHASYWIRLMIIPSLVIFVVVATAAYFYESYWILLVIIPLMVYQFIVSRLYVKNYRFYVNEEAVQIDSGVWGRQVELLQWKNIQNIGITQTVLQKRKAVANVQLVTASGIITIPYINYEDALRIQNHVVYVTAQSSRSWL